MKRRFSELATLALALAGCLLGPLAHAQPATIIVTNSADAGPGTLRQAIDDSAPGDTIAIALNAGNTITLTNGELLITNDLTIISSNTPTAIDAGSNSRVFEVAPSNTVVLDSLTITSGNAFDFGGGILVDDGASLTLTNCTVIGNVAACGGAVFISTNSAVAIYNCFFSSNSATNNGGAIDNETNSTLTIKDSTFAENLALQGGAIFSNFGTNVLNDCTFSTNSAQYGGAIANLDSVLTGTNLEVSANFAAVGGGIFNLNTSLLTLDNCALSDNLGTNYGGGIINTNGATATINNSIIFRNACPHDQGGGIDNWSTFTINNCTIAGSPSGGGFVSTGGIATCNNSTISGNVALFDGGGFYGFFGTNMLNNCTISGNSAHRRAGGFYENGSLSLLTNTIVAGNTAVTSDPDVLGDIFGANNLTNGDPLLAPLGNYGGPTPTMPPLGGSPAINNGIDSVTNLFATDQRGYPRLGGRHVDIGAVEIQPTIVLNTNDDGPGSLRVIASTFPALIAFTNTLSGQTIHLTNDQLTLSSSVEIDASSLPDGIRIDAGGASRVLEITSSNTVSLDSLTITNGNTSDNGGGILVDAGANLTLNNCALAGNVAGTGGGIFISTNGTVALNNCLLFANSATNNGGGIESYHSALTINNSTFLGNSAGSGGAIDNDTNSMLVANNSTFSSNSADNGGAIANYFGTNTLNNCTLAGNSAGNGAGIFEDPSGTSFLTNTIVAGNTATNTPDILGPFDGANNLIGGNPLLAPLGNYGGPTLTMPPMFGSAAIDAGLDSAAASLIADQRGYPRQSGRHVDIGAVEAQLPPADNRPVLRLSRAQSGGARIITFTNIPTADFTVLSTTNIALPVNKWTVLGPPIQNPPDQFQLTDQTTTNSKTRFYLVVSP